MLFTNPPLLENPLQIPSLVAWWDCSDDAEMAFSGTNITSLNDKAPGGQQLIFDTNRPYHAQPANAINSRPSAGFGSGISQSFKTSGDNSNHKFGSGQFTIVVVITNTDVDRSTVVHRGDSTTFYNFRIHDTDDDNGKATAVTKSIAAVVGKVASADEDFGDGNPYILTMLRDSSSYLRLYNNDSEVSESPDTTASGDLDPASGTHYVWVGSDRGSDQWFVGQIGEVLLFNDDLSSDERAYLHKYLRKKWLIS
jgi:hypothetical protein